jgi:prevent-host-death family protein
MEATMHEAKTGLSRLVARAVAGEDVILTKGKNRAPIARIVPIEAPPAIKREKRPIGLFAAEMGPGPDLDEFAPMSADELALWEAPIVSAWPDYSPNSPVSGAGK